jgi:hypothetical protein
MNERIRQLARQAQVGSAEFGNGISYFVSTEETFNKFAELIVRECAKFLDENSGYDDANNAWHPEPEELLEHFGVSE